VWVEIEGKIHRDEKLTISDFAAAGLSLIPVGGNELSKGFKALALKVPKKIGIRIVRKGLDIDATRKFLKMLAKQKNPLLKKTGKYHDKEPYYEVLRDSGCLKKGKYIRLDPAHARAPGANTEALPHGHIEIYREKGERFIEIGKCVVEDYGGKDYTFVLKD